MNTVITFPWPNHDLHPNARVIWQVKQLRVKTARKDGYWLTMACETRWAFTGFVGAMEVLYTFHSPNKAHRDIDNLIANMKPTLDGVMDALGTNDNQVKRVIGEWGPVVKGGEVVMTLRPFDDGTMKF
jgi:crossover junction endodeoxyribonuclease RusA